TANPQQYMRNALFLGTGGERLMQGAQMAGLANSDWTWTVKLSDFDCDGLPDVFMTNGMSKNFNESDNAAVLAKAGETEWDRHVRAGTEELREQNLAFKNEGDLKFTNMSRAWGLDHVGMSFGAAHADLDRDGDLDLVVCNLGEPVSIYRNNTIGGNRLVISLKGAGANKFGVGSKVTLIMDDDSVQQRQLIPVRGYLASNEPLVHFGLGERQPKSLTIEWAAGHRQEVGHLKANHHYTISQSKESLPADPAEGDLEPMFVKSKALEGAGHRENEFDDFIRQPLLPNKMSRLGPGQAWGDLDGDDDDDFWLGGAAGSAGQIWINGGAGSFTKKNLQVLSGDAAYEDMGGLWFDADGNGTMDLYVVSGGSDFEPGGSELEDRLYLNTGGELSLASKGAIPASLISGGVVAGADFDRDGDIDLFVGGRQIPGAYPESAPSMLLTNKGGKFSDAGLKVEGMITSALWSDANGDGWLDLLLTSEWGPIRVFQNTEGKLVEVTGGTGLANYTGWWNGIAGGDFDGDGDIDYAVTNFGLNTKYHASEGHPALIYYGDFENLGRKRIVEAEFEDDVLYPGRGRSCSSNAMPHLRKSFTSFKQFAGAALTDIYQSDRLKNALRLNATTFESGVLINNSEAGGAVQFTFQALPRVAQIAPSFGVVVDDFNHDGKADLYLAQNFHSPQVETGRMSGGLSQLLLGNGDGNFEPIPAEQSGLWVPGDAASLTRVDVNEDGAVDFVVGKNNAPLEVFERRGGGAKSIQVKLKGSVGNSTAVGARITLKTQSGKVRSQEIYAGGGYLSQSPSGLYFAIPEEKAVSTLEVIWPNGAKTSHQVDQAEGVLVISQPN
ncbi:MAG: FG-GAP-like repeat-containing protein, partial [Akkermansiaceae bacterium]